MSHVKAKEAAGSDTEGLPGGKQRSYLRHPRPDVPESKVEHQADQPGVTTGGKS